MVTPNATTLFICFVLVVSIATTAIPTATTGRVGEIVLNPTHAPPGTLVTFEGVGWNLTPVVEYLITTCIVSGEPVKVDRYAVCEIKSRRGVYEPVGSFKVANVPAGTYLISVTVNPDGLTAEQEFTVDAPTAVVTATSTTTTQKRSATTETSLTTTAPVTVTVPTTEVVTIQREEPLNQSLLLVAVVAVAGLVIVSLAIVTRKAHQK